jgi:chorismate dehydratase
MWRLGVVPYLNADPLAAALREPNAAELVGEAVEVSATVPSQLLQVLLEDRLDAALVSIGGVLPHPSLRILPEMCISSRGAVQSILLFCRRPVWEVRTVALDASSRSAVALTRVLFAERWRTQPEFLTRPPKLAEMLAEADAALLIGNPALQAAQALERGEWNGPLPERLDLGAEWDAMTGLPFVYAAWVVPPGRDVDRLTRLLLRAKQWGLDRVELLAARGAQELGLPPALTLEYITRSIRYHLGPDECAGMERFRELAVRHGILPPESEVRLAEYRSAT